jgi:hypothetical protein
MVKTSSGYDPAFTLLHLHQDQTLPLSVAQQNACRTTGALTRY